MALLHYLWSKTAASNATADANINMAEGMAPSAVNDGIRALMASAAGFRDDISGAIVTGGSATAYTVTSNQVFDTLAHLSGHMIAFVPHATNTNAVGVDITLNVDGLGAKSIRAQPGVALPNGSLILGTPYVVTYNNSDAVFYLQGMTNPYQIPLGAGLDFWGATAPNTSFAFPTGQAISRTTYATLFAIFSTQYGVGDGSTTFNLPDKTGRVSAMKEATATRLTTAGSGVDGATFGAAGGLQTHTLTTAQLASHTHVNTLNDPGHSHVLISGQAAAASGGGFAAPRMDISDGTCPTNAVTTGVSINNAAAGSGTAHNNVQPTIVCNYIIRII